MLIYILYDTLANSNLKLNYYTGILKLATYPQKGHAT